MNQTWYKISSLNFLSLPSRFLIVFFSTTIYSQLFNSSNRIFFFLKDNNFVQKRKGKIYKKDHKPGTKSTPPHNTQGITKLYLQFQKKEKGPASPSQRPQSLQLQEPRETKQENLVFHTRPKHLKQLSPNFSSIGEIIKDPAMQSFVILSFKSP